MAKSNSGGLVYSSESGRICPTCENPVDQCTCQKRQTAPRGDGIVRVQRETKGRKGKGVTLITGLPLTMDQLQTLAKKIKQSCGTGGTVKDGVIEIQGDHRDTIVQELTKQGYEAKKAGS